MKLDGLQFSCYLEAHPNPSKLLTNPTSKAVVILLLSLQVYSSLDPYYKQTLKESYIPLIENQTLSAMFTQNRP